MRERRGSALVTVVLVVLVLTIIGVGIAYFTQVEDRISGNTRTSKAAFYVADSGLRKAEGVLTAVVAQSISLSTILVDKGYTKLKMPNGGYDAVVLDGTGFTFLALADQKPFMNVPIATIDPAPGAGTPTAVAADRGRYDLYVRNNSEDTAGTATTDTDQIVNIISVGHIVLPGGATITKILEEQVLVGASGSDSGSQKGANAGGTGTGSKR